MLSSPKYIFSTYEGFNNIRSPRLCFNGQEKMAKVLPLDVPARGSGVDGIRCSQRAGIFFVVGSCVTTDPGQLSEGSWSFPSSEWKPNDRGPHGLQDEAQTPRVVSMMPSLATFYLSLWAPTRSSFCNFPEMSCSLLLPDFESCFQKAPLTPCS